MLSVANTHNLIAVESLRRQLQLTHNESQMLLGCHQNPRLAFTYSPTSGPEPTCKPQGAAQITLAGALMP